MTLELATLILGYGLKYGPDVAVMITNLFKKKDITIQDIENLFAEIKPYEFYNIPDKAPSSPQTTT